MFNNNSDDKNIIFFTVEEITEQIENDLFCLKNYGNYLDPEEYLKYIVKIFPKDEKYSFAFNKFIYNIRENKLNLCDALNILLNILKNHNK